MRLDQRIGVTM